MNNVVYVRYAESSRIAFIDQVLRPHISTDLFDSFLKGIKMGPILKSITMNYKAPVVFPDTILMASRVPAEHIQLDRFKQEFIAVSHEQERIVAQGEATIVSFDYEHLTKAPLPDQVKDILIRVDAQMRLGESKL